MEPPPQLYPPPASPGRYRSSGQVGEVVKALLLAAIVGVLAYYAGRANMVPVPGAAPPPDSSWAGAWFKRKGTGDGFELPVIELRKGVRGWSGRIISPGPDNSRDIGLDLEEIQLAEDSLTFVVTNGSRVKYRLARSAPDLAELFSIVDAAHDLANYLGESNGGATVHSPARRERLLQDLGQPRPPERIARMSRVNVSAAGKPVSPVSHVASDPGERDMPAKGTGR